MMSGEKTNVRMPSALWTSSDYHHCGFDDLCPFMVLPFEDNNDGDFDIQVHIKGAKRPL